MAMSLPNLQLPIPRHYNPNKVGEIWQVQYLVRASEAAEWAHQHQIKPAAKDTFKVSLIAIDVQITFCIPGFELFVGGRSGYGAVQDNQRLCEFIYKNLGSITQITATLDTHTAMQIFHPIFLVDDLGNHPAPHTQITYEDIDLGRWKFNTDISVSLGIEKDNGQEHLLHYTKELNDRGKYDLTIWPYHVMLGSIGHALVPAVEEAIFFHTIARSSQADFQVKGSYPLTEHYSALGPEVTIGPCGRIIAEKSSAFINKLHEFDAVIIAGQAKSHCVAWTIDDLLGEIRETDERLVHKVYLLEDCTSPVVIPGIVDYTVQAEQAFARFAEAGMHVVQSTDPMQNWLEFH